MSDTTNKSTCSSNNGSHQGRLARMGGQDELEDEAAMVAVRLAAKRCEAREWKVTAYEEDWQVIFDEDVDKE
ncbi:hypothetical protein FACUT_14126 [Fusarium acutatum]|uniref:Uncharacterized protein n=1 Tax=Fusarium acutatum TaxID=78861 RepID=A0A8H4N809_9HYPO|nr:hypothetical protein FACUT_14126 [Fusarium acutatum]